MSTIPQSSSAASTVSSSTVATKSATEASYDAIPYCSFPVPASHPDRMYNVARLFGLDPVLPENSTVLELGCAGGGNLIPLASRFPKASFVGVELSKVQCDYAISAANYVGLKNLEIRHASITDINADLGKFDYIICHGVFSWVPDFVRDAILQVSSSNLTERGVAFISYNTLPGWYFRGMLRGMMLQHVQGIEDPQTKTAQARTLLKFLAEANEGSNSMHAVFLRNEAVAFDKHPDQYVYHEYLEAHNKAFYFKEFVEEAFKHGLQFLGESDLPSNWIGNLNEKAKTKLENVNDAVLRSHYMDCINNRTFRESLLVHANAKIDRSISTDLLTAARFSGSLKELDPTDEPSQSSNSTQKSYKLASGRVLSTPERSTQLAAECLDEVYPCSLSLVELHQQIEERLAKESSHSRIELKQLASAMIHWTLSGWIQFRFLDDRMKASGFNRPKVTAWTRSQARAGDLVTNQAHNVIRISGPERLVLPMLDGTRDMASLANEMELLVRSGAIDLQLTDENRNLKGKELHRHAAQQIIERLAASSFLLPELK